MFFTAKNDFTSQNMVSFEFAEKHNSETISGWGEAPIWPGQAGPGEPPIWPGQASHRNQVASQLPRKARETAKHAPAPASPAAVGVHTSPCKTEAPPPTALGTGCLGLQNQAFGVRGILVTLFIRFFMTLKSVLMNFGALGTGL